MTDLAFRAEGTERAVSRASAPAPRRRRWTRTAPLAIIAADLVVIAVLVRNSYYKADDWIMFSVGKSDGWTWHTISFNLYNHFAPVEWVLHLMVYAVAPLDYSSGLAVIVILCGGMLLSLWWVLRQLGAPTILTLGSLALVGTSPVLINSALWYGEAVFIPVFVTGMSLVIGFFVRWCRLGRPRDAAAAWLALALSLLVGEVPLLVLPLLVVLRYVVIEPPRLRGLPAAVWRDRWVWAPFVVLGGAFAWFFHSHYYGPEPRPGASQIFGMLAYAAVRLVRGIIGIPIVPTTAVRVLTDAAFVAVVVGVVVACRRSSRARRSVVFFAVYFVLKQLALGLGVAGKYGANLITADPQYYVDLMVVAILAVALATGRLHPAPGRAAVSPTAGSAPPTVTPPAPRMRQGRNQRVAFALACAVLGVLVLHAIAAPVGISDLLRGNVVATQSRQYVSTLRAGLARIDHARAHATVVSLDLPGFVAPAFIAPYNRQDVFFRLVPEWKAFDVGPVVAVDSSGRLADVEASKAVSVAPTSNAITASGLHRSTASDGAACFTGGSDPGQIIVALPTPIDGSPLVADILVRAAVPLSMTPAAGAGGHWTYSPVTTGSASGVQRIVTWLPGSQLSAVALSSIVPHSSFCITGFQVGVMVTTAHGGGPCRSMGLDGTIGAPAACGRPWS